jgi:hypothetical protein
MIIPGNLTDLSGMVAAAMATIDQVKHGVSPPEEASVLKSQG